MNDRDITSVLDRLVDTLDDEVGDWRDVLERSGKRGHAPEPTRPRRWRPVRPRWAFVLVGATVVAAALALTVAAPWRGGPTILERAAAAILTPTSGQVLHESIVIHSYPSTSSAQGDDVPVHVWLDGASPHRFRVTFVTPPEITDGFERGEIAGSRGEIGGRLGSVTGLSYDLSDDVLYPVTFYRPISQSALDPAVFIKKALTSGNAQLDGRTTLRGHEVIRIRLSSDYFGRPQPIALYFVDAHTYRPVRVTLLADGRLYPPRIGFPLFSLSFQPATSTSATSSARRGQVPRIGLGHAVVCDFVQYSYLAPTAANRRLTNIRAMHPRVPIV